MKTRSPALLLSLLTLSGALEAGQTPRTAATPPAKKAPVAAAVRRPKTRKVVTDRWVMARTEPMLNLGVQRAKDHKKDALAGLATVMALAERAPAGMARQRLEHVADSTPGQIGEQARWLAASLHSQAQQAALPGLVGSLAILGPFQDTTGGVKRSDITEGDAASWADRSKSYSWGVYEVKWRPVVTTVTARGVPLDLYLAPRRESCSYVASRVTLPKAGPVEVHLASSGAARLIWDGQPVGVSEEVHEQAMFDRIGARIEATAGDHLVAARVCAGTMEDAGRVRLRLAAPDGKELVFQSSRDLAPLAGKTFEKVKSKPIVEALAGALAAARSPEDSLASAVLRRLGGVDDLRSPRAPGLLEEASRGGLASDRLAMAGWVSPFGANRSGMLGEARERALLEGDDETADFTMRRLAGARLEAGFVDWARAALASAPTSRATDEEAALLRALVRASSDGDGEKRAALADLVALADKGRGSAALWGMIAQLGRQFDPTIELRARDELARILPERFDVERVRAAAALDGAAVSGAARAALEQGGLSSGDEIAVVGALLTSAGRDGDARSLLGVGAQLAPNVPAVQQGLASALLSSPKPDERTAGVVVLARARELAPTDARLRAEIAMRTGAGQGGAGPAGSGDGAAKPGTGGRAPLRDERWLVTPEALVARARAAPPSPGSVVDRQTYWMRAVTQHDDRRVSQLIQYGREIVIEPRQQEELYENVPMEGDETEIVRARVHRAGGGTVFAEEARSDQGRPVIRWPDLKAGDVVEVVVRSWTSGPIGRRGDPPFYFLDYGGSVATHPLLFNQVVLDMPRERALAVDLLNGKADRVERKEEGDRVITQYVWDRPVAFPDEPFAPRPSEIFPTLAVSSFATWDEFRGWYQGATAGFTEPDAQVRQLAAELTKGKTTRDEKLRALFDFVADDIRYVNYVSGEWWLPNRPQQLLARRQGDCDDKALLLITLLKAVGIEATEVLIQTRQTAQPSLLLSKKAAVPLFDHGIALLPAADGQPARWLDATSPQSRLGPLPSMDARTYALFASEGPAQMTPTPRSSPAEHGVDSRWEVALEPSGAATIASTETHRGDHAFFLRTALREKDARAPWVEQNLLGDWVAQAQVTGEVDFDGDLANGEARVGYHARSLALGRNEGPDLVVQLAPPSTITSQLAPLPRRTLPVVLPSQVAPSRTAGTIVVQAPPGMRAGPLPPGGEAQGGEFGVARLEITASPDGRTVTLQRSITIDQDIIPVDRYEAWRAWLTQVDGLRHRSIRFVPAR